MMIEWFIRWRVRGHARGTARTMLLSFMVFREKHPGRGLPSEYLKLALATRLGWRQIGDSFFEHKSGLGIEIRDEDSVGKVVKGIVEAEIRSIVFGRSDEDYLLNIAMNEIDNDYSSSQKGMLSRMFYFFSNDRRRRTRAAENITWIFYSALLGPLDLERGKLPERLRHDIFLLAYIYGVTSYMSVVSRIKDTREIGFLVMEVYERLFPGRGEEIVEQCNNLVTAKDELFLSVVRTAQSEMGTLFRNGGRGIPRSLIEHIRKTYESDDT